MSALRMNLPGAPVRLVDPHTRQDYRPLLISWNETAPVEVRHATPVELAREGGPHKARTDIHLFPARRRARGLYIAHLTDEQVLAAIATAPNLDAAAAKLNTSQASLSRRLRQIRAGVTA